MADDRGDKRARRPEPKAAGARERGAGRDQAARDTGVRAARAAGPPAQRAVHGGVREPRGRAAAEPTGGRGPVGLLPREEIARRASYGPKSPVVGERGARTRQHIIDVALALFEDRGFHDTSVDDIAKAAGISRATLYQYFASKDQLFRELLDECGSVMMRVVRRLGPLGPTPEGFDNLHWWLGEWAWVYEKYATMFTQWAHIDVAETPLRPLVIRFVDTYAERVARRLESSGVRGVDRTHLAAALLVVVHRVHYLRHAGMTPTLTDDELLDGLAVVIQLVLFPGTPPEALTGYDLQPVRAGDPQPAGLPEPLPRPDRFDALSARAHRTVRQLMEAAYRLFAARGYAATSIDDIVTEAGVARGTFYKYFQDKLDLLTVLGQEAGADLVRQMSGFTALQAGPGGSEQLRDWLRGMLPLQRKYAGVVRAWIENQPADPAVALLGRQVGHHVRIAFGQVFGHVKRPYPLSLDVAAVVLSATLERIPEAITELSGGMDDVLETVAWFIERGLLNGEPVAATTT